MTGFAGYDDWKATDPHDLDPEPCPRCGEEGDGPTCGDCGYRAPHPHDEPDHPMIDARAADAAAESYFADLRERGER